MEKPSFLCKILPKRKPKVAILRLTGMIASSSGGVRSGLHLEAIRDDIDAAFALKRLDQVILAIHSPGGSPVQSELIYRYIRLKAAEKKVKVTAMVEDIAASGGYMLACAADKIYASPSSIIGSIGVISSGFGFHQAIQKAGVERRIYTQGSNKSILDPFLPENPKDIDIIHAVQEGVYEAFVALVKERRPMLAAASPSQQADLFSGKFWAGEAAKALGLIDDLGTTDSILHAQYGEKVQIVRFGPKKSWFQRKLNIGLASIVANLPAQMLQALEEQALWQRHGR